MALRARTDYSWLRGLQHMQIALANTTVEVKESLPLNVQLRGIGLSAILCGAGFRVWPRER
jgi:hypothetical protein